MAGGPQVHLSLSFGPQVANRDYVRCAHRIPLRRWEFKHKENEENTIMKNLILNSLNRLHQDEAGQGLVEYMLIIALVAFAATAGMSSLASGLNSAMIKIGSVLGVYIQ
jgi:pilus assembly protein Flp/PilA